MQASTKQYVPLNDFVSVRFTCKCCNTELTLPLQDDDRILVDAIRFGNQVGRSVAWMNLLKLCPRNAGCPTFLHPDHCYLYYTESGELIARLTVDELREFGTPAEV